MIWLGLGLGNGHGWLRERAFLGYLGLMADDDTQGIIGRTATIDEYTVYTLTAWTLSAKTRAGTATDLRGGLVRRPDLIQ